MKYSLRLSTFAFLFFQFIFSQTGEVTGTLIDADFQDPVPFANILVQGTTKGTTSDFDGNYKLALEEGTHTLTFSFLGYKTVEITDVLIKADEITTVNVTMETLAEGLD
ncbi:MAG TPA: TonB-dependent receptor, partial [Arenibacter sp.]|nr:TonB-dependent receptor [Arenibacter sp.]